MGKQQQQSSHARRTRAAILKGERRKVQERQPSTTPPALLLEPPPPPPPPLSPSSIEAESRTHAEQQELPSARQIPLHPPRFSQVYGQPSSTNDPAPIRSPPLPHPSTMAYPPPPPEIDPAATGGYGAYAANGSTDPYATVDESGHHVQHLPPISEALHPDDVNNPANTADHLGVHSAHYGNHASTNAYDPQQHTDPSASSATNQHGHYEQQSSNFFDTQLMEPPPPADATAHHQAHASAAMHNQGHTNGYSTSIMTPPPPTSSQGYPSSPYQSAGASAPLFHRASISGPVMHSHYAPPTGTPSTGQGADVWSSTPAAARPHTADGMFASHMGGLPGQWASISDYNRGHRGSTSSMSDAAPTSGGGKVFSYMPSTGDDSSSTAGSQSHHTSGGPRKRPRRRYDEIERLYTCSWPGCQKSYGTLNHLNAHVAMQKHGPKRSPAEFKEMRKAWRKGKREEEQRRQASAAAANEDALSRSKMMFATPNQPFMTHGGYSMNNFGGQSAHQMPPPAPAPAAASHFPGHNGRGAYGYSSAGMDANRSYVGGQGGAAGSSGLGAYLMAHRGSI